MNNFSLLSDAEIRQLCVPPETYLNQKLYDRYIWMNQISLPLTAGPASDRVMREAIEARRIRAIKAATLPVTPEMRAAFVPMIEDFVASSVRAQSCTVDDANFGDLPPEAQPIAFSRKVLSYGLSSVGYDVRLAEKFQVFTNNHSVIVDPKKPDPRMLVDLDVRVDEDGSKYVIMPPHTYGMGYTVESFNMPRDVMAMCLGKSTYARSALFVNVTPIEPGFRGQVVIEVGNVSGSPLKVYLNEGIAQFLFLRSNPCEVSYADRGGKYMHQRALTLARV